MDVIMPQLGETVDEGTITVWHKKVGEPVTKGEVLFEIATDKVDMEVPAPADGFLNEIVVDEGDTVKVGVKLGTISDSDRASESPSSTHEVEPAANATGSAARKVMDVVMPQLGETVEEGTVTNWLKKPGERVEKDEILFEIATDKVDMEVPAPMSGFLTKILVEQGQTVKVGEQLAVIGDAPETTESPAVSTTPAAEGRPSDSLVTDRREEGKIGKRDSQGRPLSPVVRKLLGEHRIEPAAIAGTGKDGRIKRQDVIAFIQESAKEAPQHEASPRANAEVSLDLAPSVRTLLNEYGINPSEIQGSGADGRITRRDALEHIERRGAPAASPQQASDSITAVSQPSPSIDDDERTVIPFKRIRKLTAEHMVRSKATSPHVLQAVEVDFSKVEQARHAHQSAWKVKEGYSLTYLPFIARALCMAIAEFPYVNASVEDDSLVVHRRVNLGVAVDLDFEGLMVPVLKDAQRKGARELAREIRDLSARARDHKLSPDELAGGTYTISNSGPFGTLITAPVINQPQVAILSTDGVRKRPVVVERPDGDAIAIRPVGVLAQSFDHRAFDGAYSAAFLRRLRHTLEHHDWMAELA